MDNNTLHIATLGIYANERVDHAVMKRSVDKVAIIYTQANRNEVEEIKDRYHQYGIPITTKEVEPWNYEKILASILQVVADHPGYSPEFNVSCGTRLMTAAAHTAALLADAPILFVNETDDSGSREVVEVKPIWKSSLTEPKKNILGRIVELGEYDVPQKELGSRTELGVSSISRHLSDLEELGYIEKRKDGRRNLLSITDLGRVILRMKQIRKQRMWG